MRHKKREKAKITQKSINKKIRNAKMMELPDGTKFRSKLELFTYQKLLEANINDFSYEKDKFILQDAFEFPNESYEAYERSQDKAKIKIFGDVDRKIRSMSYLPDFTRINPDTKTGWILEVKGYSNDALIHFKKAPWYSNIL